MTSLPAFKEPFTSDPFGAPSCPRGLRVTVTVIIAKIRATRPKHCLLIFLFRLAIIFSLFPPVFMKHIDLTGIPDSLVDSSFRTPNQSSRCTSMLMKLSLTKKLAAFVVFVYLIVFVDFGLLRKSTSKYEFNLEFKNFHEPSNFVITPNVRACIGKKPPIIFIMVISNSNNFKERQAIRSTWASPVYSKAIKDGRAAVNFIVSRPTTKEAVRRLSAEVKQYSDILVTDLEETYENLILKVYASILFSTKFCNRASFHMKVDDDVVLHLDRIFHFLVDSNSTRNSLMCKVWSKAKPIRDQRNKWYISKQEWSDERFPKYCNGPMYVIGMSAARKILNSARNIDMFKLEDVFFTGIAAQKTKIQHIWWSKHMRSRDEELWWGESECDRRSEPLLFSVHSLNSTEKMKKGFDTMRNLRCVDGKIIERRREALLQKRLNETASSTLTEEESYNNKR